MVRLGVILGPLIFVLWVYCLVRAITARDDEVRNLPKIVWIFLIIIVPLVGSIAWLAAGQPLNRPAPRSRHERAAPAYPEYDRPGRAAATDPEADEEFLRKVRARAEEQRRRERERRLAAEKEREEQERRRGTSEELDPD